MSKIKLKGSSNFKSLFYQLIQYSNFKTYLGSLIFQTHIMTHKQVLGAKRKYNEVIVKMANSHCINYTERELAKKLDDQQNDNYTHFPV